MVFRHVPPQHVCPAPHGTIGHVPVRQIPPTHVAPAPHAIPHPPQWSELVCVLTHVPPQHVCPAPQAGPMPQPGRMQMPPAQLPPGPHEMPHPPQLFTSEARLLSHPFMAMRSQSPNPALHDPTPQRPDAQFAAPFATGGHATPQPPQWFTSPAVFTHDALQHV